MQRQPVFNRHAERPGARGKRRRGVSSVLAMMFLVIFGSLAAAMAVVAQGNLRTADSALKVSRAMSAAETGLVYAARRLEQESGRFVVEKGVIDASFADDLWMGTLSGHNVTILPPSGYTVATPPAGIVYAVRDGHLAGDHWITPEPGDPSLPEINTETGTLRVRPIALQAVNGVPDEDGPYFRLRYEIYEDLPIVRVTSIGVDGSVSRQLQMDFRIEKKIEYAILSPNRIMIGKNVMVEGPLGSRFGVVPEELDTENGDPLVMRSDFYYLHETLDNTLDTFFTQVVNFDVDGDGRLRPDHPVEGGAFIGHPELVDYDGDEFVDDCDLFMNYFDANGDGMVVYDSTLASEAGLGALGEEFAGVDDQMARLIDEARADRDADGAYTVSDRSLGYRDGVIDLNDLYAKVTGRLAFAVSRQAWELAHGASYQTVVQGPIRSEIDVAPVTFEVGQEDLLEITTEMFSTSQTWFEAQVPADPPTSPDNFNDQVAAGIAAGGTYTLPEDSQWETVPFGSLGSYDYYQRPVYEDMTFQNVRLPMGNNGLYVNCTFISVTFIESEIACEDENWNFTGAVMAEAQFDPVTGDPIIDPVTGEQQILYVPKFPDLMSQVGAGFVNDTRPYSNNIRFHNCTFLGSISGDRINEYTHWRNKVQMTGFTRFYLDPDDEELAQQPDSATLIAHLNGIDPLDRLELAKSSMLMPGWSVDVGNFDNEQAVNPEDTPTVKLRGTLITGILDVRGTADVHGTVLMTFRPTEGAGPLFYGGQADSFNTTIGYFGPDDGDPEGTSPGDPEFNGFGEIRLRYDPDAALPDGIPWPVRMRPVAGSYVEGDVS